MEHNAHAGVLEGHHAHDHAHSHDHGDNHETFVSKYVFSMDHKVICRQFLITAVVMAVVAMVMSIIFRLQLAWPGEKFAFIEAIMGRKCGKDGILDPNAYLSL